MKWIKNILTNLIKFSICFILTLITANGLLDLYNRRIQSSHEKLMDEAMELEVVMNSVLRALNNSDLGFRGYYIVPTDQLLHPFLEARDSFTSHVSRAKEIMESQGFDPDKIDPVEKSFIKYFSLIEQMVEWRNKENYAAIDSVIASDPGFSVWEIYRGFKEGLDSDIKEIIAESQARTEKLLFISTSVRISLFALGIPTLLILLFRLNRERKRRIQLFHELDENNRKYLFNPGERKEFGLDEKVIIDSLIKNLAKASDFISKIAKGNFNISWDGLTEENKEVNKENLAGELLQMREQMQKVKEEDTIRMWTTEGISKFAELVRQNQNDIYLLTDKITSEVVKYLGANQASLFFVEEKEKKDEVVLQLYSCYAYDRKRYLEKAIEPGQGLVGQTYLEKEIVYITSIPQNYVKITSGLGEATPNSLIVVPLKFNDQVEGILEIASFKTFKHHEFEFLNKIGEIIASAITTIRSSTEVKKLMESLQSQSEEMKAQEEEMRQNMEELQATQEETTRKTTEYQDLLIAKDEILGKKTQEIERLQNEIKLLKNLM